MLAYLFWHRPTPGVDGSHYESVVRQFHESMRDAPSSGLVSSACYRLDTIPWLAAEDGGTGGPGFEDWYLVADSGALDRLNEAAIDARHRSFHDAAAVIAGDGAGGLYSLVLPAAGWEADRTTRGRIGFRLAVQDPGGSLLQFMPALMGAAPSEARIWQRRLVLGPSPEFCIELRGRAGVEFPGADPLILRRSIVV